MKKMTKELAIRILNGDVLGTKEQTYEAIKMAINALEVEPTRHGHWNIIEGMPTQCSLCGYYVKQKTYKYCPYCGALMEAKDEDAN